MVIFFRPQNYSPITFYLYPITYLLLSFHCKNAIRKDHCEADSRNGV